DVAPTSTHATQVADGYASSAQQMVSSGGPTSSAVQQTVAATITGFAGAVPPTPAMDAGSIMRPPEFHGYVAMLREHPRVLRALGLIIDLRVPVAAIAGLGV